MEREHMETDQLDGPAQPSAQGGRPIYAIEGEKVALGPLHRALLPSLERWTNDFYLARTTSGMPPLSPEQVSALYERAVADENMVSFVIYDRATGRPVGTTYLSNIDLRNRTAEFGIAIGEAEYRGRGYGTETTRLMLDYAFTVRALHSVMLTVYEFNRAGQRAYEKAGFRTFGRRRECHWMGGRLWDEIYMECLASEFESPILHQFYYPDVALDGPPRAETGRLRDDATQAEV
jgi:RimJ/RimL family protein N-acetyltransferase